ncbi:PAQR family membrane homeostasis protein TrhA [Enhygromyxa salina]|uniref:Hemolysin-III related n=1 Tax=Enhygromyxa salina TaxID=215803 RepID=A0A2S9XLC6_9BACT|nr:hemolysin III family protein [Enhygromyxa salina]PRP93688.1 hemolysin-III related [Enhygromyxa salina]
MNAASEPAEKFSPPEELANAISASVGMVLSIVALVVMVVSASGKGAVYVASAAVFGGSLVALYLASALNHALVAGRAKHFFHNVDLAAIYLLIAGTYTPFTLVALHNRTGNLMFCAIWILALIGTVRTLIKPNEYEAKLDKVGVISYLAMGWMVLVAPAQIIAAIPTAGLIWILVGGAFYSGGVFFFRMTKLRYHHLIWHLFVIGGSACHVIAIQRYVLTIVPL